MHAPASNPQGSQASAKDDRLIILGQSLATTDMMLNMHKKSAEAQLISARQCMYNVVVGFAVVLVWRMWQWQQASGQTCTLCNTDLARSAHAGSAAHQL